MIERQVGPCLHRTYGGGYSELVLPDGRTIPSVPQETAEYEARALELGYADGAAMSREHDAIHAALAGVFGVASPALVAVADGGYLDAWQEEELVKLVALRLNAPASDALPGGGLIAWLREQLRGPCRRQ